METQTVQTPQLNKPYEQTHVNRRKQKRAGGTVE